MKKINKIKINKIKTIIIMMISTVILNTFLLPSNVFAASASIRASSTSIYVGETANINVSVTATETWNVKLSTTGGSLSQQTNADAAGQEVSKDVLTSTFSSNNAGTYTISLSGQIAGSDLVKHNISGTVTITVKEKETTTPTQPEEPVTGGDSKTNTTTPTETTKPQTTITTIKSSNNSLASLTVSEGTLSPKFYRDTTDYTVTFPEDYDLKSLKNIKITAKAEDSKAKKITGTGDITLNDGENNLEVNVTAENGSVKTYNIKITKPVPLTQSDMRLKSLEVNKIDKDGKFIKATLDKEFNPETLEYICDVESSITDMDITPTVDKEDIVITVNGAENLKDGENTITIKLTAKDDENIQTTYTIKVNKEASKEVSADVVEQNKNGFKLDYKTIAIIIIAVIVVLLITLIVLIIIEHKKKKSNIAYSGNKDEIEENNEESQAFINIKNRLDFIENRKENDEEKEEVREDRETVENEKNKEDYIKKEEKEETEEDYIENEVHDEKSDNEDSLIDEKSNETEVNEKKKDKHHRGKHF